MLVLSRRENERLILSVGDVTIIVSPVDIRRESVRIGIEAPACVSISREEIIHTAPPNTDAIKLQKLGPAKKPTLQTGSGDKLVCAICGNILPECVCEPATTIGHWYRRGGTNG